MKNEIVFVRIGEYRDPENFLRKVGPLYQVQITEKTKVETVAFQLLAMRQHDVDFVKMVSKYFEPVSKEEEKMSFMAYHNFRPEPGLKLYAIFEIKKIQT